MRESNNRLYVLAQGAMIAAIYVVLTILFAPISFGPVQFRIAEALCSAGPCPWTWYSEAWQR